MKTACRTLTMMSAMSIVLLLANCSEDGDPGPDDLMVGIWTVSSLDATITVGSQSLVDYYISQGMSAEDAQEEAQITVDHYENVNEKIEFKSGGTYSTSSGGSTTTGTWELSSDGNTLTINKGTPGAVIYTVVTLTSTNLNLTGDWSDSNSGFTMSIHVDFALTR